MIEKFIRMICKSAKAPFRIVINMSGRSFLQKLKNLKREEFRATLNVQKIVMIN